MIDNRKLVFPASPPEALKQVGGSSAPNNGSAAAERPGDEAYQTMREVGGRAWQLHAATRAADRFIRQDTSADRSTGSWLVACAVDIAEDVAAELDAVARGLKERPADAALSAALHPLRASAHKLHAAARAADHFLDQDTGEDRSTASWLVACALDLASRLAAELDDQASEFKRGNVGGSSSSGSSARADNNDPTAFSDVVAGRKSALRGAVAG